MATFSIGDAVGAGFDVIRRRPVSVLAWGLAYFVLAVLPSAGLIALVGDDFVELFRQAANGSEAEPNVEELMRLNTTMTAYQPVAFLTALAARAVLTAAVFRAVLEPENRGFFYLRFGKDELWQALISLSLGVLFFIAAMIALFAGGALGAIVWFAGSLAPAPWSGLIQGLGIAAVVIAAVVGLVWVALRLSLAGPMSFADRTFRLFESWTLTRGQSGRLFGLAVLLFVVIVIIELVVAAVGWIGVLGFGFSGGFDPERIEAFFAQPFDQWVAALLPAVAVLAVVGSLLTGAVYAIFTAPWAAVYRQLGAAKTAEV